MARNIWAASTVCLFQDPVIVAILYCVRGPVGFSVASSPWSAPSGLLATEVPVLETFQLQSQMRAHIEGTEDCACIHFPEISGSKVCAWSSTKASTVA